MRGRWNLSLLEGSRLGNVAAQFPIIGVEAIRRVRNGGRGVACPRVRYCLQDTRVKIGRDDEQAATTRRDGLISID